MAISAAWPLEAARPINRSRL